MEFKHCHDLFNIFYESNFFLKTVSINCVSEEISLSYVVWLVHHTATGIGSDFFHIFFHGRSTNVTFMDST